MSELTMPKMGDAMEEGTIVRWLKKEGDKVESGEIVAEISTEKANIEIPATESGVISEILVKEGETVPVLTPIARLNGAKGGGAPAPKAAEAKAEKPGKTASAPSSQERGATLPDKDQVPGEVAPSPTTASGDLGQGSNAHAAPTAGAPAPAAEGERVKASPLARKVAAEHGIDLRAVAGTGPGGRIIEADVAEALRRGPAAAPTAQPQAARPAPAAAQAPGTSRAMSPMRKVIAKRLSESKQTIPHFYVTSDVDMRAAVRLRSEFNAGADESRRISFNDLVVRACVMALERFPALGSQLQGDSITTPGSINIGVAVSLEEGLIVPVLKNAQDLSISAIGRQVRELAERARSGGLKPDDYSGGTFTVSNLGMYDVTQFQAIINPPEAAILAVGAIRDTPIVDGEQIVPGKQMYLTLSVDHRLVDGHVAAQFMQEVKRLLQSPLNLLG